MFLVVLLFFCVKSKRFNLLDLYEHLEDKLNAKRNELKGPDLDYLINHGDIQSLLYNLEPYRYTGTMLNRVRYRDPDE